MNPQEARRHLVPTYHQNGSISQTARLWHTSRQVVRKGVRRFQEQGEEGLRDHSRRPHHSPRQTPSSHRRTSPGSAPGDTLRPREARPLPAKEGTEPSLHTIRHILDRRDPIESPHQRRQPLYPTLWSWEVEEPFSLIQTDVKDILDKQTLGPALWDHLRQHHLPRYQWTACEARMRLRFLAYSPFLNRTHGLAFLILVLLSLRVHGITTLVTFQTDWGQEFGGDNPREIAALEATQRLQWPGGEEPPNGR